MSAVVFSLIGVATTLLGLIVAVVRYTTKNEMWVKEMRPLVRRIPHIDYRLQTVEAKLDISAPEYLNGSSNHEEKD